MASHRRVEGYPETVIRGPGTSDAALSWTWEPRVDVYDVTRVAEIDVL